MNTPTPSTEVPSSAPGVTTQSSAAAETTSAPGNLGNWQAGTGNINRGHGVPPKTETFKRGSYLYKKLYYLLEMKLDKINAKKARTWQMNNTSFVNNHHR